MSDDFSIQNSLGKIDDGLMERVRCVLFSTIRGAKHLVVAIKGKPPLQESLAEGKLVHLMESGQLFNDKDSHIVWITD